MTHSIHIRGLVARSFLSAALAAGSLAAGTAQAGVSGISGPSFNLAASPSNISMPDGTQVYTWAYGCGAAPSGAIAGSGAVAPATAPAIVPSAYLAAGGSCGLGQLPGPTLIVTEGQTVTVNLYNGLPALAGNTSIVFPGFQVTSANAVATAAPFTVPAAAPYTFTPPAGANLQNQSVAYATGATSTGALTPVAAGATLAAGQYSFSKGTYTFSAADTGQALSVTYTTTTGASTGVPGLVTQEAAPGTTVTYTFVAARPGTYAYYSGTRSELQVEMGLYGAVVVLPANPVAAASCSLANPTLRGISGGAVGGTDYRLATSAYDHASTCYDREYLFQFHEMDGNIHQAVQDCVNAQDASPGACPQINVVTDPFHPNYFLINGRAFPDDTDPTYTALYPNQPYNGNPQIHPGETMLLRVIGQGRWQHPFHIHANHGRVVARDGNLLLSASDAKQLAGPLYYTVPTVSGQAQDLLFTYTGKGLNWDIYGHNLNQFPPLPTGPTLANNPAADPTPCYPDTNGYYTTNSSPAAPANASNYYEWCADHNKPIPITPPDPQIVANGLWYGGTPYLGLLQVPVGGGSPQFLSTPLPPGANIQNPTAGYAFMWHSHAERELTTNNVFPGGMLMMLIVQPPAAAIDETL